MKQPTYHTKLPPQVRFDRELSANAKLLYGEVKALCDQQGYCWASNHYLATLYGVHRETISLWLRQLRERGLIRIRLMPEEGNQRRIYLENIAAKGLTSYEETQERTDKISRGLVSISPPSCESIVGGRTSLLIEKSIDNNDRVHSVPINDLSRSDLVSSEKDNEENILSQEVQYPEEQGAPAQKKKKSLVRPTVKEAEDYMMSQKELCPDALTARTQALRFVNYYESNGWKVGRNTMQDWKAAANNWLLNTQAYLPAGSPRQNRLHSGGKKDYSIPL